MTVPPAVPPDGGSAVSPPAESSAGRDDGGLSPEWRALLLAKRQLQEATKEYQKRRAAEVEDYRRRKAEDEARKKREAEDAAERAALEDLPRSPGLPLHKRRNRALNVQDEDLDELLPDGWGSMWPEECERLSARMGVPPLAVPYLMILQWVHGLRPALTRSARVMGTGCGLQHTPEWMARKLGCSTRWANKIQARLDPLAEHRRELRRAKWRNAWREKAGKPPLPLPKKPEGRTCYVLRFQQLRRLETLTRDLPAPQRRARWLCRADKLRSFADVVGVTYPTLMGCRLLRRRARVRDRARPGHRPQIRRSPMQEDLYRRLAPLYRRLRARLSAAVPKEFSPYTVKPYVPKYVRGPGVGGLRPPGGADPPEGGAHDARRRRGRV